jgi:hypothetical protein
MLTPVNLPGMVEWYGKGGKGIWSMPILVKYIHTKMKVPVLQQKEWWQEFLRY